MAINYFADTLKQANDIANKYSKPTPLTPITGNSAINPLSGGYESNISQQSVVTPKAPARLPKSTDALTPATPTVTNKVTATTPNITATKTTTATAPTTPTTTEATGTPQISDAEYSRRYNDLLSKGITPTVGDVLDNYEEITKSLALGAPATGTKTDTATTTTTDGKATDTTTTTEGKVQLTPTQQQIQDELNKVIAPTQERITEQEKVFDTAQAGLIAKQKDLENTLANYKTEYTNQNVMTRLKRQENNEKAMADATAAMDRELAKQGVVNYDTESMNADTRRLYNAYLAKTTAIKAENDLLNGNIARATETIDGFYNNQEQYLRDQINNYNNVLTSSTNELGRLDTKERTFIASKINNLQTTLAAEEKKREQVQTMKQDVNTFTRAMKDFGLSLEDDVDTQIGKFNQAKQAQNTINTLSDKFLRANILPTDTLEEAKKKLMLDPDFITNFGANVDVISNSKNGATYAYNKVTGKYTPISQGLSDAELSALDPKDVRTLELQYKKDFDNNVTNFKEVLRYTQQMEDAMAEINKGGNVLSAANQALITSFNKILDPASVVREGEYDRTTSGQTLVNRALSAIDKVNKGTTLQPDEAKAYMEIAQRVTKRMGKQFMSSADMLVNQVASINGDINRVLGGEDMNTLNMLATDELTEAIQLNPDLAAQINSKFPDLPDYEKLQLMKRVSTGGAFNDVVGDTNQAKNTNTLIDVTDRSRMRTDRHNNPAAIMYEGFKDMFDGLGYREGVDYFKGDTFPSKEGGNKYHTIAFANPEQGLQATIDLIDTYGFYTGSGKQRWSHTAIPQSTWLDMSRDQKIQTIKKMYKAEGGSELNSLFE